MTGTLEFIAKPLADTLGMHHVCATVCETLNDRFISAPPAVHPIGQEKLRLGKDLCRKLGYELSGCTAYGNSADDIPLLEAVSQPVAVYPAPSLRRVAIDRSWEIVT